MVIKEKMEATTNQPEASRHKQTNLIRMANKTRQKMRPFIPADLDFEVIIIN